MKNPNSDINKVLEWMVSRMKVSEIKEKTKNYDEFYLQYGIGITPKEWEWLIRQAEKTARYEKALKQIHETAMNNSVDDAMVYGYTAKQALEGK